MKKILSRPILSIEAGFEQDLKGLLQPKWFYDPANRRLRIIGDA